MSMVVVKMKSNNELPTVIDAASVDYVLGELVKVRAMRYEAERAVPVLTTMSKETGNAAKLAMSRKQLEKANLLQQQFSRQVKTIAALHSAIKRYSAYEIAILEWLSLR